jgi:hypothetical protein
MKKFLLLLAAVVGLGLVAAPKAEAYTSFGISIGGGGYYPYAPYYGGYYPYGYGYYAPYPYYSGAYYYGAPRYYYRGVRYYGRPYSRVYRGRVYSRGYSRDRSYYRGDRRVVTHRRNR